MATDAVAQGRDGGGDAGPAMPLRILRHRAMAAGNPLCPRPALFVVIETSAAGVWDPDAVPRLLAALAPDLEDEFRLARVEGPDEPLPRVFAGLMVALMAERRDLAARVARLPMVPRSRWSVQVEGGISVRPAAVLELAVDLLLAAIAGRPADLALGRQLERRCGTAGDRFAHLQRAAMAAAIEARGHAWRAGAYAPVGSVGEGRWRIGLSQTMNRATAWPGSILAERKDLTRQRLALAGLPVPRQIRVADAAAARDAAAAIGYPVVVKPMDCSNARGVSVGLATPAAVTAAFAAARIHSPIIAVESQLPGQPFRLLVIGGRLAAALLHARGRLVGDGRRSLRDLVDAANGIPTRRGPRPSQRRIAWTAEFLEYLAAGGLGPESVPAAGAEVLLHWSGHGGRGGAALPIDGPIHPDNRIAACQAAELIGLDVAGIDLVLPDIARSWRETGGGICEVNRSPGLGSHLEADGLDAPLLDRYVEHLMDRPGLPGAGRPRTIPILVFVGGGETERPALAAAALLRRAGLAAGLAVAGRFQAAGLPLADPGPGSPLRVVRLVDDPSVEAIVAAVPAVAILEHGLGHGRADLAVVAGGQREDRAAAQLGRLGARVVTAEDLADGRLVARIVERHRAGHPRPAAAGRPAATRVRTR